MTGNQPTGNEHDGVSRRALFLYGTLAVGGICGAAAVLAKGVIGYLIGPQLSASRRARILDRLIDSLKADAALAQLRLERITQARIPIARVSELADERGHIFTDYFLQPGIVYRAASGGVIARSAVCTHLGCTVQSDLVDGKIFCPCHLSYFDANSGNPVAGPATHGLSQEPIAIEGDVVYLVKPEVPIKIGPTQTEMEPV